jgi:hypothetical protein
MLLSIEKNLSFSSILKFEVQEKTAEKEGLIRRGRNGRIFLCLRCHLKATGPTQCPLF